MNEIAERLITIAVKLEQVALALTVVDEKITQALSDIRAELEEIKGNP